MIDYFIYIVALITKATLVYYIPCVDDFYPYYEEHDI